jgi:oligosaccharyltransferase complex subunit beta
MLSYKCIFFVFLVLFIAFTNQTSKKTLVLVDSLDIKTTHSQFFEILQQRGYDLDIKLASDSKNALTTYGEYNYDKLIILAPATEELGGELSTKSILDFVDSNHDVIIVSSNVLSEPLREVARESGIDFDDDETTVIDHFNYNVAMDEGNHATIVADNFIDRKIILASKPSPVLYKGLAMAFQDDSKMYIPILTGSETSYSFTEDQIDDDPHVAGKSTILVAGLQARNGARMTFIGSLDMLSDKFFNSKFKRFNVNGSPIEGKAGNKEFVIELTKWALRERGVLRHRDIYHHKINETEMPDVYRIGDHIEYNVIIEEYTDGKWVPYIADDIQIELVMLDPYIRTFLKHVKDGKYTVQMRVPDVYGVFKFKVDYRRVGYTSLTYTDQIVIRPLRINEYERFIEKAFPYYASVFSMMIGFLIFGIVFLYTKEDVKHKVD